MNIKAIISVFLTFALLAGCGRAGAPLRPSEAAQKQAKANNEPAPPKTVLNKNNPDKRFVLDGLLE